MPAVLYPFYIGFRLLKRLGFYHRRVGGDKKYEKMSWLTNHAPARCYTLYNEHSLKEALKGKNSKSVKNITTLVNVIIKKRTSENVFLKHISKFV